MAEASAERLQNASRCVGIEMCFLDAEARAFNIIAQSLFVLRQPACSSFTDLKCDCDVD